MKKRTKRRLFSIIKYIVLVGALVIIIAPIIWMFIASLMENSQLFSRPPEFNIFKGSLDTYKDLISNTKYVTYYKNSLIVAGSTVLLCLVVSTFAGYALSRYRFFGRNVMMSSILSVQMFPLVAILISLYTVFASLDLINTYLGLILADTVFALPLSIWLLKSFFDTIPTSLDESARIDGCTRIGTIFRVIVPLLRPGLLAVGTYTFLQTWDDYLFGMIIMNRDAMRTLPVGIAQSFIGEFAFNYSGMMALSVATSIPIMIIFIFMQKHMIAGLTGGAVKG